MLLAGSFAAFNSVAQADAPPVSLTPAPVRGEIKALDAFLDTHSVIDDESAIIRPWPTTRILLKTIRSMRSSLTDHPGVADQLKDHPRYFMHRALENQRDQPITPDEVKTFDAFLDAHPDIDKELMAHPRLADDPKYIEAHPALHDFLNDHPRVSAALESKPVRTMEKEETPTPAFHEIKELDAFLDEHPVIDDLLREHPALADNPDFIKDHPEYADFLADHPGVADQLKDHPRYFIHRTLETQSDQPITPAEVKTSMHFSTNIPTSTKRWRPIPSWPMTRNSSKPIPNYVIS